MVGGGIDHHLPRISRLPRRGHVSQHLHQHVLAHPIVTLRARSEPSSSSQPSLHNRRSISPISIGTLERALERRPERSGGAAEEKPVSCPLDKRVTTNPKTPPQRIPSWKKPGHSSNSPALSHKALRALLPRSHTGRHSPPSATPQARPGHFQEALPQTPQKPIATPNPAPEGNPGASAPPPNNG